MDGGCSQKTRIPKAGFPGILFRSTIFGVVLLDLEHQVVFDADLVYLIKLSFQPVEVNFLVH